MSNRSQIVSRVLIGVVFVAVVAGGYLLYRYLNQPALSHLAAIPESSALFIEVNRAGHVAESLQENNLIWEELLNIPAVSDLDSLLGHMQSIINQDESLSGLIRQNKLCIAFPKVGEEVRPLFLMSLQDAIKSKQLYRSIESHFTIAKTEIIKSGQLSKAELVCLQEGFCFFISQGLFVGGPDKATVMTAFDQMQKKSGLTTDDDFQKLAVTAGKKVNANIYLRYPEARPFIASLTSKEETSAPFLVDFARMSEIDLIIKQDELLMNGYTLPATSDYLACYSESSPQEISMPRILPYNTAKIFWIGFDDASVLHKRIIQFLEDTFPDKKAKEQLNTLASLHQFEPERDFLSLISREAACINKNGEAGKQETYCIFHVKDPLKAWGIMQKYVVSDLSNDAMKLFKISLQSLPQHIFGPGFEGGKQQYITLIDNYLVFGNSSQELHAFAATYRSGKTLDINDNFTQFSDNLAAESNILYYYNIRNQFINDLPLLSPSLQTALQNSSDILTKFQAASFQFSLLNDMFYTNFYLKYNPDYKEEDRSLWKAELKDVLVGKPFLVKDHRTGRNKIVAFDASNSMYLIDEQGNIIWQNPVGNALISNVFPVDYYKNGKIQYLFNTEDEIYLIDLMGRAVDNYPIGLNKKASSGLALFDYNNNRDYRMLIPSEDKKTYNYDIKGSQIKGWNNPKTPERVAITPTHLVEGGKDYIILTDQEGNVKIVDRKGKNRIQIKGDFTKGKNSGYYINETNSKGIIMTTDHRGHLTYIKTNGKTDETVFGEFSEDHYFLYSDFDRNGHNDFIFVDGDQLTIYDRFKKLLFSFTFAGPIHNLPVIINVSSNEQLLGIVDDASQQVYLFDRHGKALIREGLIGTTPFTVGSLNNDGTLNLIVGADRFLYNYPMD